MAVTIIGPTVGSITHSRFKSKKIDVEVNEVEGVEQIKIQYGDVFTLLVSDENDMIEFLDINELHDMTVVDELVQKTLEHIIKTYFKKVMNDNR